MAEAEAVGSVQNPSTVVLIAAAVTGVQAINWTQDRVLIPCPVSNGETYAGAPVQGPVTGLAGSIVFSNPVLAQAFSILPAGDLTATVVPSGGELNNTLIIENVTPGKPGSAVAIGQPSAATVPFLYGASLSSTDPVQWSTV